MVVPKNAEQWGMARMFMEHYALVLPSPKADFIGWTSEGNLVIGVAIDGFIGKTAMIHVAMTPGWHYPPRDMMNAVFKHCFECRKVEMLLGVVNSNNERAMVFDRRLGFTEIARLPGMHDDGGDMVLLGMTRDQCQYLEGERAHVHA